jgi:hypothetical protein
MCPGQSSSLVINQLFLNPKPQFHNLVALNIDLVDGSVYEGGENCSLVLLSHNLSQPPTSSRNCAPATKNDFKYWTCSSFLQVSAKCADSIAPQLFEALASALS